MTDKGPEAFRTISEASAEVGAPAHVLRFWESRLSFIRPMRRAGGRRLYRPRDIRLLAAVRRLLQDEGLSLDDLRPLSAGAVLDRAERSAGSETAAPPPLAPGKSALRLALDRALAAKHRLDDLLAYSGV